MIIVDKKYFSQKKSSVSSQKHLPDTQEKEYYESDALHSFGYIYILALQFIVYCLLSSYVVQLHHVHL